MLSSLVKLVDLDESYLTWKEEQYRSSVFESLPRTGCFPDYMGAPESCSFG